MVVILNEHDLVIPMALASNWLKTTLLHKRFNCYSQPFIITKISEITLRYLFWDISSHISVYDTSMMVNRERKFQKKFRCQIFGDLT